MRSTPETSGMPLHTAVHQQVIKNAHGSCQSLHMIHKFTAHFLRRTRRGDKRPDRCTACALPSCSHGDNCGGVGQMRTIGIAKESVAATDDAGVDPLHHERHRPCACQLVIGRAPVVTLVRPPANIQAHTQTASPGGSAMNALMMRDSNIRQVTCLAPRDSSTLFRWTI